MTVTGRRRTEFNTRLLAWLASPSLSLGRARLVTESRVTGRTWHSGPGGGTSRAGPGLGLRGLREPESAAEPPTVTQSDGVTVTVTLARAAAAAGPPAQAQAVPSPAGPQPGPGPPGRRGARPL